MRFSYHLTALAILGTLAGAGRAQATVFDCAINAGPAQNGFITKRYIFDYDPAKNTVTVLDGLIQHFTGGPLHGKVTGDNASRTTFSWPLQIVNDSGQQARLNFTAAYLKASKSAVISVTVGGGAYTGGWDARGTCVSK